MKPLCSAGGKEPGRWGGEPAADVALASALSAAVLALRRPTSLLAIAVLLLNDHWLKAAFPSWVTGKLSDFAGLYFFPFFLLAVIFLALLVTTMWPQGRSALTIRAACVEVVGLAAFLTTALLFGALKAFDTTSQPVVSFLEAVVEGPVTVVVDPTDLVALGVLPFSYCGWRRVLAQQRQARVARAINSGRWGRLAHMAPLFAAGIASLATSRAPGPSLVALAAVPQDPGGLYASVRAPVNASWERSTYRLLRSGDSGGHWALIAEDGGGEQMLVLPGEPWRFVLPRQGGVWLWSPAQDRAVRIWPTRPDDGRENRETVPLAAVGPWSQPVLFVARGGEVAASPDAGATWRDLSPIPGLIVRAIAAHPARPGYVVLAGEQRLYLTQDGGGAWSDQGPVPPVSVLFVPPGGDGVLLVGGSDGRLYRSADDGRTWQPTWQEDPKALAFSEILASSADASRLLATRADGWVLESRDEGRTWTGQTMKVSPLDLAVASVPEGRVFVANPSAGVFRQRRGLTLPWQADWQPVNEGLHVGATDLGERQANVFWLLMVGLAGLAFVRLVTPGRLRHYVADHAWEIAVWFASGVLIAALVVGYAAPGNCVSPREAVTLVVPAGALVMLGLSAVAPMTPPIQWLMFGAFGVTFASAAVAGAGLLFPLWEAPLIPSAIGAVVGALGARKGRLRRARFGLVAAWGLLLLVEPWIQISLYGLFGPECR